VDDIFPDAMFCLATEGEFKVTAQGLFDTCIEFPSNIINELKDGDFKYIDANECKLI
jgi:hypothetical protein